MPESPAHPIHVTVIASPDDPRHQTTPEGVVIHHVAELHPDDVETLPNGLRITSVARTLVDLAEEMDRDELRSAFAEARRRELLDIGAVLASRGRVEWRSSLALLDEVIEEFSAHDR
jgi:hypothetical protein